MNLNEAENGPTFGECYFSYQSSALLINFLKHNSIKYFVLEKSKI